MRIARQKRSPKALTASSFTFIVAALNGCFFFHGPSKKMEIFYVSLKTTTPRRGGPFYFLSRMKNI